MTLRLHVYNLAYHALDDIPLSIFEGSLDLILTQPRVDHFQVSRALPDDIEGQSTISTHASHARGSVQPLIVRANKGKHRVEVISCQVGV